LKYRASLVGFEHLAHEASFSLPCKIVHQLALKKSKTFLKIKKKIRNYLTNSVIKKKLYSLFNLNLKDLIVLRIIRQFGKKNIKIKLKE
jgi:hypothetical protein